MSTTDLRCRWNWHAWRDIGLMNIWRQYRIRCSRCGTERVMQG